jgi:hypothetical protein
MAHLVRTERGIRAFETVEEAEEFGRLQYVNGGTPAYQITRDDRVQPTSVLRNGVVHPYRPRDVRNVVRAAKRIGKK